MVGEVLPVLLEAVYSLKMVLKKGKIVILPLYTPPPVLSLVPCNRIPLWHTGYGWGEGFLFPKIRIKPELSSFSYEDALFDR